MEDKTNPKDLSSTKEDTNNLSTVCSSESILQDVVVGKVASSAHKNSVNTNLLVKKCSIFDSTQSKAFIDSIKETAEIEQTNEQDLLDNADGNTHQLIDLDLIETLTISENLYCTTCQITLINRADQLEHYKCDVHLFNIKQKLRAKPIVSVDEFEQLSDISSISGSDSEAEENNAHKYSSSDTDEEDTEQRKLPKGPKLAFNLKDGNVLVMQRCILHGKKEFVGNDQVMAKIRAIKSDDYWSIILVAGGHFAAAIFKGDEAIMHKTFHRYVVRAKRGTVQSQHDKASHAKSAGASIRRSQEAAFKDDIRTLLGCTWKSELEKCKCVFIRVASYNRSVLISSNSKPHENSAVSLATSTPPFSKDDLRLRNIPFMTLRPTFKEVKRVHFILSQLQIFNPTYLAVLAKLNNTSLDKPEQNKTIPQIKPKSSKKLTKKKQSTDSTIDAEISESDISDQDQDFDNKFITQEILPESNEYIQSLPPNELDLFNNIYTACITNDHTKLTDHLSVSSKASEHAALINKLLSRRLNKEKGSTLLHVASELGHAECVWLLLLNGCDPAVRDLTAKTLVAYTLAVNKATKDKFRRCMYEYPDRYDYEASKVPGPLSEEQANDKSEKEKEKKKLQKLKKKQRLTESKDTKTKEDIELAERQLFVSLTDQQKRSLTIDRNFANIAPSHSREEYESKLTKEQKERLLVAEKRAKFYESKQSQVNTNSNNNEASKPKLDLNELIKIVCRCWKCGVDLSGSTPFGYLDFKFCSTKCLAMHREGNKK